jgi:predicted DCC family thiol-disulfide oxidoreductase YuxK
MASKNPVILFDGVCNLCHGAVNFIIDRDPASTFRFASLQSTTGREEVARHGLDPEELSSLVLIDQGRAYRRSTAALRIARRLRFPWNLAFLGMIVPAPLRDWVYDYIAQRRYRWFGKSETCRLPTPDRAGRFLE